MDGNNYKKSKNVGTRENINKEILQLQKQREDNINLSIEEKIKNEREYIKNGLEIIKNKCKNELEKTKIRMQENDEYLNKLKDLEQKWLKTNEKLAHGVDIEDNYGTLKKISNHICEIIASIDNKDFRTYNILPIWDIDGQPTGLEQAIQNYELIIDDYLNTLGSNSLEKLDKTKEGYEYRQNIDKEFEQAVLKLDIDKVKDCIKKGAYVNLQLEGKMNTALNYVLIDDVLDLPNRPQKSEEEKIELAKLLLENGADSNIPYYRGDDEDREMRNGKLIEPIIKAIEMENYELVSLILKNNEQVGIKVLEDILDSEDVLFVKRLLNEIVVKGTVNRLRVPKRLKNYIARSDDKDFIISMCNNKLINVYDVARIFIEKNNVTLLKAMDELGYDFDFSDMSLRLMLRIMFEKKDTESINFIFDKLRNFEIQKYLEEDGNINLIKKQIESNADLEMLDKFYKKDPTIDLKRFKIVIPNYKYILATKDYLNKISELKKKNADISYEAPGVNREFDDYVLKMMNHDTSYKEQELSQETLAKRDENGNSIFHYIAIFGDLEDLKKAQEKVNFNINEQNRYEKTPLSCAIKAKNTEISEELIRNNRLDWNIDLGLSMNPNFNYRNTYLTEAIEVNDLELAKRIMLFLEKEKIDIGGETELKLSILCNANDIAKEIIYKNTKKEELGEDTIIFAAIHGNKEVAKALLDKKIDVNKKDELGNTALFEAVKNQDIEMIRLLVKNKANINIRNELFETPIMYAVKHNLKESTKELIELGANLSIQEYSDDKKYGTGKSVLHYAKDKDTLQELIINGANPYKKDAKGRYAFDVEKVSNLYMALDKEIGKTHIDEAKVDKIIKELGEDINTPTPYRPSFTAVSYAAYRGNTKILEKLLQNGGNINVMDNGHTDALMSALIAKKEDCALYLIDHGIDLNHSDKIGNNALMMSIYNGFDKVAEKIINKGVDLEKSTRYGNPLIIAIECKRVNIIKQLIEHNASLDVKNMYGVSVDKLIDKLKNEYSKDDKEYKILDDILKNKKITKNKTIELDVKR